MLILAKAILAMMIGFILSVIFGLFFIPFVKKRHITQKVSEYVTQHKQKNGTSTMGGLIFIIPTIVTVVILLLLNKIEFTENLFIVLFVFVSYAILGFLDDFLIIKRGNNSGLTILQKLFGQLFIALIFFYIFIHNGNDPVLTINTLGLDININMGWLHGIFILFVLLAGSNSVNITDGLDGLAGGLSLIAFLAFGLISWNATWILGSEDIAVFCFILVGSLLGFLFYNTHPAKIFMGDTGSLSLGATLAAIAILTNHEVTLIIVGGVFIIETLSSLIQIIAIRKFHRKVFLMAPIHHHFEKLGWQEQDIVKVFWVVGFILSMIGIGFAVWI